MHTFTATLLATLALIATPAIGQDRVRQIGDIVIDPTNVAVISQDAEKSGLVWYYVDRARTSVTELSDALSDRDRAFTELTSRVKGGDRNKGHALAEERFNCQHRGSLELPKGE